MLEERQEWALSRDNQMFEQIKNPEELSVGDVRVRFYTHRSALDKGRKLVTMLGRQKGDTVDH